MSIEEYIVQTLSTLNLPIVMGTYLGGAERYISVQYEAETCAEGDDEPTMVAYAVYVYYICPIAENSFSKRKQIANLLVNAGFDSPEISRTGEIKAVTQALKQGWLFETALAGCADWEV